MSANRRRLSFGLSPQTPLIVAPIVAFFLHYPQANRPPGGLLQSSKSPSSIADFGEDTGRPIHNPCMEQVSGIILRSYYLLIEV